MNRAPHCIRLLGPWELTLGADELSCPERPQAVDGSLPGVLRGISPAVQRVRLPDDWRQVLVGLERGPVRLSRRFHQPTGLKPADEVRLCLPAAWRPLAVELNGARVTIETVARPRRELLELLGDLTAEPHASVEVEPVGADADAALSIAACGIDGPIRASESQRLSLWLAPGQFGERDGGCVWIEILSRDAAAR